MIGPALSSSLRRLSSRIAGAGVVVEGADVETVAEVLLSVLSEDVCTCGNLVVAMDPEEHDDGCAYLELVGALEDAALARNGTPLDRRGRALTA